MDGSLVCSTRWGVVECRFTCAYVLVFKAWETDNAGEDINIEEMMIW